MIVNPLNYAPLSSMSTQEDQEQMNVEISCPICFEEMIPPSKKVMCCSNGHPICSDCDSKIEACPVCREALGKKRQRNLFAERLILTFVKAKKP